MPDENPTGHLQSAAEFNDIISVAVKRAVFGRVVGQEVRPACADIVKEDDAVLVFESGGHEPPHVLIAAETMREDDSSGAGASLCYVKFLDDRQSAILRIRSRARVGL